MKTRTNIKNVCLGWTLVLVVGLGTGIVGCRNTPTAPGDQLAPTVALSSPSANGAVPAELTATFSEPIKRSTMTGASFFVLDVNAMRVGGVVTLDPSGEVATFTPTARFMQNQTYRATITRDVTDLAGNHLASDQTFSFSTSASTPGEPDPEPIQHGS